MVRQSEFRGKGGERTKVLIKVRVRVLCPGSKGAPYVHTKGRKVHVLVGREAIELHSGKSEMDGSRGVSRRAGEVSSDFKPLAKHWEEGLICPLRVVDRKRGSGWPYPSDPGAEGRTAAQDVGDRLRGPGGVVVPPAVGNQAVKVSVFRTHAQPVPPKGASTTKDLSHGREFMARVGGRHSQKTTRSARGDARNSEVLVRCGGHGRGEEGFPFGLGL